LDDVHKKRTRAFTARRISTAAGAACLLLGQGRFDAAIAANLKELGYGG
jgi:hypothetical protein